jgi:DNA polymerase
MSDWTDIIDGIADHIALLRELGARDVALDPALLAALEAGGPKPRGAAMSMQSEARASSPAPHPVPASAFTRTGGETSPPPSAPDLSALAARIAGCAACPLGTARTGPPAAGAGNAASPDVMFISETPLAPEDLDLLHKMIGAMGYAPSDLYVTSVCKCRPSGGRAPAQAEMTACMGILREHIKLVAPKTIVLLGEVAIKGIFALTPQLTPQLNHWIKVNDRHIMPIRHPAYLRRFPAAKHDAWHALKLVLAQLGRPVPQSPAKRA